MEEIVNDEYIINNLVNLETKKIIAAKLNKKYLNKHKQIKNYLDNRFSEKSRSYSETVARIYYGFEEIPKCKICGKPLKFHTFANPYNTKYGGWCSATCQLSDRDFINFRDKVLITEDKRKQAVIKQKETLHLKYGNENYRNVEKLKETIKNRTVEEIHESSKKREKTCLEKYGVVNVGMLPETLQKGHTEEVEKRRTASVKEAMLSKYGGYTLQSPILKEKVKSTKLERYGHPYWINQEKIKETVKKNTGYECILQSPEVREKIDYNKVQETKKRNNTFNSSKGEHQLKLFLESKFGKDNVIQSYTDDRYKNPNTKRNFVCDFYIKSLDLFIEYQGSQYHHAHPFDPNNEDDINELSRLKAESEKLHKSGNKIEFQVDNIIYDWTVRDPMKRKVALDNGIRYLEIWSQGGNKSFDLDYVKNTIEKFISNLNKN